MCHYGEPINVLLFYLNGIDGIDGMSQTAFPLFHAFHPFRLICVDRTTWYTAEAVAIVVCEYLNRRYRLRSTPS